ncbi:MAG TPA: SpoIIE family protein phosphatase [Blastocatellia bacterium]|nr:SpoIIE family protein phosphatase [Blastocatellia bacterium]
MQAESRFKVLVETVRKISVSLELSNVLELIVDSLKELVDYDAAVVCILDPKTKKINDAIARGYAQGPSKLLEPGEGIIGWVIENGNGIIVHNVEDDPRYILVRPSTRSEMAAPIINGNEEVIGAINLESDRYQAYDDSDLELLQMFASVTATAIQMTLLAREVLEKHRVDDELNLARQVVSQLLPKSTPLLPGYDLYCVNIPVAAVGGDYYDFIEVFDDRLGVVVADVSGKGMPAALVMASFRAYIHAMVLNELSIRAIFNKINKLLRASTAANMFITCFYGVIDPAISRILYINAGHNPPLLISKDGSRQLLEASGTALGILKQVRYAEQVVDFYPGDIMIMYTDGITEAVNEREEEYGLERLARVVENNSNLRAHEICSKIIEDVTAYAVDGGIADDLTVMIIKVLE